jgi:hypothetical protein
MPLHSVREDEPFGPRGSFPSGSSASRTASSVRRKLLDTLLDDDFMRRKRDDEAALRRRVASNPKLRAEIGDPWSRIEAASAPQAAIFLRHTYLEDGAGFNSRLFRYAREIVCAAAERSKPNAERLREYRDSALPELSNRSARRCRSTRSSRS